MTSQALPFLMMRGGTSRGIFLNSADLPTDRTALARLLLALMGAEHPLCIDGLGGGAPVTCKVAMLSPAKAAEDQVDYLFAQVSPEKALVDFNPTCGNMLVGVGPAAVEMGLIQPSDPVTTVAIHAVNTGARIMAKVQTPGGQVRYDGDFAIDGIPGTAAPVDLRFSRITGAVTGAMLPTGRVRQEIEGVPVTCLDIAMPVVIARAEAFGLTGHETRDALSANHAFLAKIEAVRVAAGREMGMGDVSRSVTPKMAILAPARQGGSLAARYFTPWLCHPTMAVTGGMCIAAAALLPGSAAAGLIGADAWPGPAGAVDIVIEHPAGKLAIAIEGDFSADLPIIRAGGLTRTARLISRGDVYLPGRDLPA